MATLDTHSAGGTPPPPERSISSLIDDHPRWSKTAAASEGREIVAILAPLGLPASLQDAVRLYPLVRDGIAELDEPGIPSSDQLTAEVEGLVQLGFLGP